MPLLISFGPADGIQAPKVWIIPGRLFFRPALSPSTAFRPQATGLDNIGI